MKTRYCLDLYQGTPVYWTGAFSAEPQRQVSLETIDGNHFAK